MTSYRRVSEASAPNSRVYFQVSGIKHAGTSTTLKLKLSEDSPISALFAHIDGAVERSRPPSSKYDRIPKPAQYRWHNMVLTPEVDGHRTPMALGMRCGENNVVSIEVLYPVSSPRRYEQSPISARRNIMLDSENDVGYHSNLLVERSGGRTGPVGRASDMGDSYNGARNQSARRIRDASPIDGSSSRHSAGVRAGTHRSESADRVQRTVSDILSETLRVTHTTDGKYASSTSGQQQAATTPQRQPLPPAVADAVGSRANSQSPVGRQRGASMRDRPPATKPVVGAGAGSSLLPQRRQGDAAGGSFEPTSRPPGKSMVLAVTSPEAAPRDAYVEAPPRATKHQNITPPRRYTDEYRLGHQSTSPAHARMSSPHEVRDHLTTLIKKQHAEAATKDEIIYAQQQELARLEAELGSISSNSKLPSSTQNRRATPQRSVTTPKISPGRRTASSGARRHPDEETHYSALARSANRSLNTQAMDEEAKAEALALAIRNQQQQSASKAARSGAGNTQFSKGSTIGSDTHYRHESQWSRSGRAISEEGEGSASQNIALDGIQDARHFSERARSPHHLHSQHQQSPDQRTSPPRRRGDNTLQSPVAPTRSISTPQQEDLPTASLSSSGAVPQDVLRVLQTQERTISSQQQTLIRLETEMQKLMAANARLVDDTKSSSSPVPAYHSPKRVPISISPAGNGGGASTAAATPVRQGNNSQSRNYALYTDPQEEVAALTIAVAASEREKAIREMSPPRGSVAGGDESVPHSIYSSPVAKPLSNVSTDGTADSVVDIRQQQGVIDAQQQQLMELEQQLAKLRATSATSALLKNEDTYSQKQSEARRSLLTSVTETSPTSSNQQHHQASSPASPPRGPAAAHVQHAPATPPSRQVREPSINQSPQQQQQNLYQSTPTASNNNNMGNVSNLSNVSQTQDDSVHVSRMRATALENSYLMRKVQIQEHASKDADSRIALLERQLKSQQEKLETTRRQNETLKAEVEERKRAPRGALDGKTLPGIVPSPYLYHVPARDAAEASQRIQDFKVSSPHGVSSHQHGAVDESFRSLPDDGSLSPISPHDSSYTPHRSSHQQQQYGMSTPTGGANGTVTPVFTQSLSASKYHGDQLTSSRKTNAAPSSTNGVPATDRTPTVNGTPARKQPPPPPAARK